MSERQEILSELARRRASGELTGEQAAIFDELRSRGVFKDVSARPENIKAQQQEIVERMSGEIPELLGQDIPGGKGETLGQFVTRPDVLRTGIELGGMTLGGATAPLLLGKVASKVPAILETIEGLRKTSPVLSSLVPRAAGSGVGGGAGSFASETVDPSANPLASAGTAAGIGVLGEGIGHLPKAVASGVRALRPSIREGAETAQKTLLSEGGGLSAAQAVQSPTIDLLEAFARSGAGGKGRFVKLDSKNADALDAIKTNIISKISSTTPKDSRVGSLFQDAVRKGDAAHSEAASGLYRSFDKRLSKESVVDISNVQKSATDTLARFDQIGAAPKGKLKEVLDLVTNAPAKQNFADAHFLRSTLLSISRDLGKSSNPDSRAFAAAKSLSKLVEDAMNTGARKLGPSVYRDYRNISEFYKNGKKAFDNDVVVNLMNKQPERVGEALFMSGNVSEIIQARATLRQAGRFDKSVNPSDIWEKMQAGYLRSFFGSKAATNVEGETVALNLMKELATAKTSRSFAVMFNQEQRKTISEFGRASFLALRNKPAGFGTLAPIVQASAALDFVSGLAGGPSTNNPLADIGILVSPNILAKALTRPKTVNMLTRAIKTPEQSPLRAPLISKIALEFKKLEEQEQANNNGNKILNQ